MSQHSQSPEPLQKIQDRYIKPRKQWQIDDQRCKSETTAYSSILQYKQKYEANITCPPSENRSLSIRECILEHFERTKTKKQNRVFFLDKAWDAPNVCDDFYSNPLDWSSTGHVAVVLNEEIYLTSCEGQVEQLHRKWADRVTSISLHTTNLLGAAGTISGRLEIYDLQKGQTLRSIMKGSNRIGCLVWDGDCVIAGGKDTNICGYDLRKKEPLLYTLTKHLGEICGLAQQNQILASGSNDNSVCIWELRKPTCLLQWRKHRAAVKALAWCPWKTNTIATGGGTSDKKVYIWSTESSQPQLIHEQDTGSMVSSIVWNSTYKQIISSHGAPFNCIKVWNYKDKQSPIIKLEGHRMRILSMRLSPQRDMLCTLSPDETLRFWKIDARLEEATRNSTSLVCTVR